MSNESHQTDVQPTAETTTLRPRRPWGRWIKRGILAAVVIGLLVIQWPMLKGVFYAVVPPSPASPEDLPQWREGYEQALAESRETGRPVLIDFTASWCPPCRVMEADVWPDASVRDVIAQRVIPLQLDVDKPSSAPAAQRYGVQYIPTIILVDADGRELARDGFMTAAQMIAFIDVNAPEGTAPVADAQ